MADILFVVHGAYAGKRTLMHQLEKVFKASGHTFTIKLTNAPNDTYEFVYQGALGRYSCIIIAGGDGSVNEAVNGIMKSARTDVVLGILPCGTGNDFVKTTGSPQTVEGLLHAINTNSVQTIDVGHAEFTGTDGHKQQRYFANITDVGLGGLAAELLSHSPKWFGSFLTYQFIILRSFLQYQPQRIEVQANTFTYCGDIMNFVMANGKYFGSGLGVAPDANVYDGQLNGVVIGPIGFWDYLKNLARIRACQKVDHPQLHYHSFSELTIQPGDTKVPIDMDGEFVGFLPMTVRVRPAALKLLV